MSGETQAHNLISGSATGTGWAVYGDATLQTGDVISVTTSDTNLNDINAILTAPFPATSGKSYTLTADVKATANFDEGSTGMVSLSVGIISITGIELATDWSHVSVELTPSKDASDARVAFLAMSSDGSPASLYVRDVMLVEGATPAAWAPAEGESLAGGGALMSANLLDGITPTLMGGTTESGGVWHNAGRTSTDGHEDWLVWDLAGQSALATNQTYHVGLSTRGASANSASLSATIGYRDAAGNANWATSDPLPIGTSWGRAESAIVVPSGMTPFAFYVAAYGECPETWMTAATLSYGSPVTLASDAHTPYATQDHLAAEYATKAALKVTSDAITAEVTERGKLAGRVGTLESTTGTHTSKLSQLAASITSLVKGESTYTDPDGKSATSGIYSLVTQARDSVTALFGQYTKTEDLASTAAVQEAKKAGTDAASAASAAASAASAAQSTADGAKATADGLATMIRQDADGITVGKSADGETWSTGRTHMSKNSFDVLDKAGTVVTQMAKDGASFLAGLVRIVVGTGTLPGNKTAEYISVDAGSGVAGLSGIISRLDAAIDGVTSSVSAGWERDFGYGVTAIVRKSNTVASAAHLAADKSELHVGDNHVTMTPTGFSVSNKAAARAALGITLPVPVSNGGTGATSIDAARRNLHISQGSKVCHGHGTPWVTLFDTWADFQAATGCYSSGLPTLVTMNGDWSAFDGSLSGCEIKGGDAVYVMAQTQDGIPDISSTQSLRINWICIW